MSYVFRGKKDQIVFLSCIMCFWVCGCASSNETSSYETGVLEVTYLTTASRTDSSARVLNFAIHQREVTDANSVNSGKGRIFILRPYQLYGKDSIFLFSVNGTDLAGIGNGGCFTWEQPVGSCQICSERALVDIPFVRGIYPVKDREGLKQKLEVQDGHFHYLKVHSLEDDSWCLSILNESIGRALVESSFTPVTFPDKN